MEPVQWNYNSPLANGLSREVIIYVLEDVFGDQDIIMGNDLDPVRRRINFDDPDIVNEVPPRQNPIRLIPTELNELQIQKFIHNKESCPICLTEYFMVNESGEVFKSGEDFKSGEVFKVNESCEVFLTEYLMVNESGKVLKVFKSGEVFKNGCSHYFHVECLENWLKVQNACPMCRA